jgi:hypothetical protein
MNLHNLCFSIWCHNMYVVTERQKSNIFELHRTLDIRSFRLETFVRGDQEGLFKLVILNFIFKWYNWSNFRLLTASH